MTKYLTNNFAVINLHKRPSAKSEVVTQMIYGDSLSILKKIMKLAYQGTLIYLKTMNSAEAFPAPFECSFS